MGAINFSKMNKAQAVNAMFPNKDPKKFLYYFGPRPDGQVEMVRVFKGQWTILEALVPVILIHNPGCIVEIGMGESTEVFAKYAKEYKTKLYSCDLQMGGMFNAFSEKLFYDHVCFIGKSEDFVKQFNDKPSIIFVDGQHDYVSVKMEFEILFPKLNDGGVFFLHDTFPRLERHIKNDDKKHKPGTVYRFRQELERNPDIDVFSWPYSANNMGLTMVMKHGNPRPYWLQNGRQEVPIGNGGDKHVRERTPVVS